MEKMERETPKDGPPPREIRREVSPKTRPSLEPEVEIAPDADKEAREAVKGNVLLAATAVGEAC